MTNLSVAAQLGAMGVALPHPKRADRVREKKHREREAIGAPVRAIVQTEKGYYPAFEDLLRLHGCTFFHPTTNQLTRRREGQKGWPDYVVLGMGFHAFVELKAVSLATKRKGKLDADQERYRDEIIASAGEYHCFLLPDDWRVVGAWLSAKTGRFA